MKKIITCAVVVSALFCCTAFASADTSPKVSIPVSYEVNDTVESTFILKGVGNAPMPEGSTGDTKTVSKNSSGNVDFGEITFSTPDLYEYKISKETEDREGLTKDTSTYTVHIIFSHEGQASMVIKKDGTDEKPDSIKYVDYITTKPVDEKAVYDDPPVLKTVKGDNAPDDTFTFAIKGISAPEGVDIPTIENSGKNITEIKAKAGVETEFGILTFKKPGEYVYEVYEIKDENLKNYKFDDTVYKVKYTVSEEGDKLICVRKVSVNGSSVNIAAFGFTNEYDPPIGGETPKDKNTPKGSEITEKIIKSINKTVNTGDIAMPLLIFIIMLVSAGTSLAVIRLKGYRERD